MFFQRFLEQTLIFIGSACFFTLNLICRKNIYLIGILFLSIYNIFRMERIYFLWKMIKQYISILFIISGIKLFLLARLQTKYFFFNLRQTVVFFFKSGPDCSIDTLRNENITLYQFGFTDLTKFCIKNLNLLTRKKGQHWENCF